MIASLAVFLLGWAVYVLRGVLTPVFFAFLIAYMLDPVVDRLEGLRIPRAAGITLVLSVVLGALGLFVLLAVPGIVRDVLAFAETLPDRIEAVLERIDPWLAEMGYEVPHTIDEAVAQLDIDTGQIAGRAAEPVAAVLGWIVGGTASVLGAVAGLLMVPIFAFYLLYDFDRMIAGVRDLTPWRVRPFVVDVAREVDEVLGQFIRGQLIVMLILAVLYAVGYSIVGVRLAVVIGIVAGLLSFIPYVGGAVALGLALLMAFLDFAGWNQVIGVVVVYGVIQILEGFVITPKIVGDKVGLSAVWVLFALLVGGEVFGFLGVLLAVPAAAVAKIFVLRAVAWYRTSHVFLQGAPQPPVTAAGAEGHAVSGMLREEGLPDDPDVAEAKRRVEHPDEPPGPDAGGGAETRPDTQTAPAAAAPPESAPEREREGETPVETSSEDPAETPPEPPPDDPPGTEKPG